MHADVEGSGEGDARRARMVDQRLADIAAVAIEVVEDTRRESCIAQAVGQQSA